jgi:internalin A
MNRLESVPDLQCLAIDGKSITGRGLARLRGLSHLDTLILQRTGMTDADLVHLEGLTQLRSLHLCDRTFTTEGIRRLQQALPDCKIER